MTTAQIALPTVRPITTTPVAVSTVQAVNMAPAINRTSIYISTILATTLIFFFGVGLPCLFAYNLAWGLGLGAMCAFWGGPGFGVMIAGARVLMVEEKLGIHPPHP